MNKQSLEQIRFIENILRTNEEKAQSIYYTIKIERYGEFTNVIDRSAGADVFLTDMEKTIKTHKPDQVIIELFSSKSKRIKYPSNTYKLLFEKGQNTTQIQISKPLANNFGQEQPTVKPQEEFISIHQYIQESLDSSRQQMSLEFNLKTLEFELKQKDKEISDLKEELEQCQEEIEEKDNELAELIKKDAKGGLGSVTLGNVGSSLLEKFFFSKTGRALASSLGADLNMLEGLLGKTKSEGDKKIGESSQLSTARIINDEEKKSKKTHSGKKLEDYGQIALFNLFRVDGLNPEERTQSLLKILNQSDELYSMMFLQLLMAIKEEALFSVDLQKFHLAIVSAFNERKKDLKKTEQVTIITKKDEPTNNLEDSQNQNEDIDPSDDVL